MICLSNYILFFDDKVISTKTRAIVKLNKEYKEALLNQNFSYFSIEEIKNLLRLNILTNDSNQDYLEVEKKLYLYQKNNCDLTILLTTNCNCSCLYCYDNKTNQILSKDDYDLILDYINDKLKSGVKIVRISWFGGEPLLCANDIIFFMNRLTKLCESSNTQLFSSMTTNFTLCNLNLFEQLVKSGVTYFQITLDGDEKTHNYYRPCVNKNVSSYEAIFQNLDNAKKSKLTFTINVRLNFDNTTDYERHIKHICNRFGDDKRFVFTINPISNWGKEGHIFACNKDMVESRENELKTIFNKYNKQLEDTNNPEMCISFCPFLLNNKLLIMPDCSIRKCSIFLDDNINNIATKINQIDDKSIKKLTWWTKEAYKDCKLCCVYPICLGRKCKMKKFKNRKACSSYFSNKYLKELFRNEK